MTKLIIAFETCRFIWVLQFREAAEISLQTLLFCGTRVYAYKMFLQSYSEAQGVPEWANADCDTVQKFLECGPLGAGERMQPNKKHNV